MTKKIVADFSLCTGCAICLLACSERVTGGFNPRYALMRIENKMDGLVNEPILCSQCTNAYCKQVCPVNAIEVVNNDQVLKINQDKCNGCGLCEKYCPHDVIVIHDKRAAKCDLCDGEVRCVSQCPTGALQLVERGELHE